MPFVGFSQHNPLPLPPPPHTSSSCSLHSPELLISAQLQSSEKEKKRANQGSVIRAISDAALTPDKNKFFWFIKQIQWSEEEAEAGSHHSRAAVWTRYLSDVHIHPVLTLDTLVRRLLSRDRSG